MLYKHKKKGGNLSDPMRNLLCYHIEVQEPALVIFVYDKTLL